MRIDKFLKVSRLIKRRTVANDACEAHRIFVNDKVVKPSYQIKQGDVLEIRFAKSVTKVRITDVSNIVKKQDASSLYEIMD